jgi:hypothetical protein
LILNAQFSMRMSRSPRNADEVIFAMSLRNLTALQPQFVRLLVFALVSLTHSTYVAFGADFSAPSHE